MDLEEHVQNVKWLDYAKNMMDIQRSVYLSSSMFDVIIAAGEIRCKAHQIILASCSDFFVEILSQYVGHAVPTVIIPDLNPNLVEPLLEYMYTGETFVTPNSLQDFVEVCGCLKIKGFVNDDCLINGMPMEGNRTVKGAKQQVSIAHHQHHHHQEIQSSIEYGEHPEYMFVDVVESKVGLSTEEFEHSNEEYLEEVIDDNNGESGEDNVKYHVDEEVQMPSNTSQLQNCSVSQIIVKAKSKKLAPEKHKGVKYTLNNSMRNMALENAVRAVTEDGRSLKEASVLYSIPKTVLWRKLKTSALYKPEERTRAIRSEATAAMERGETLISISKKYNVPLSTLHRDKVRLFAQGKLPKDCKVTRREAGPGYKNRLKKAVACCEKGMSQKVAAEMYGVPKTTIWRHLQQLNKALAAESTRSKIDFDSAKDRSHEDGRAVDDYEGNGEIIDCEVDGSSV